MTYRFTVALDAMGGDLGPDAVVPGAAMALPHIGEGVRFLFFGDESEISARLSRHPELRDISDIHHTDEFVSSDEKPSVALRSGRNSSMRLAINAVAEGRAECVVSGGNTGALMAMAKMVLKCLPGITRPAIAGPFPTINGETILLDLGANLGCDAEILAQFAVLGAVYARAVKGIDNPSVGLLNVGSEEMKGHDHLRMAAAILSEVDFPGQFYGFVEGNDIPMGKVDVVVTDGFTGNVALKTAEGVGKLTEHFIRQGFKASLLARIGGLLAYGAMKKIKQQVDPRHYNGGMFLGLSGVCVKSHGGSDPYGFSRAVITASDLVEHDFNKRVAVEIQQLISQESFFSQDVGREVGAAVV